MSHLCIAVLRWRLAGGCRRRWDSEWSRPAGRWCTWSPRRGVRWADAGCRWSRWRWAWRCWARRRWLYWQVENWGLLGGEIKQKKENKWVHLNWIAKHWENYFHYVLRKKWCKGTQTETLPSAESKHKQHRYTRARPLCLCSNGGTRLRRESITNPQVFFFCFFFSWGGNLWKMSLSTVLVRVVPCWLPLLKMMKPLCNFWGSKRRRKKYGLNRRRLQSEIRLSEQVVKTQSCLLLLYIIKKTK